MLAVESEGFKRSGWGTDSAKPGLFLGFPYLTQGGPITNVLWDVGTWK